MRSHPSFGWVVVLALIVACGTPPTAHSQSGGGIPSGPPDVTDSVHETNALPLGDLQYPLIRALYDEATALLRAEFGSRVGLLSTVADRSGSIIRIKDLTDEEQQQALAMVAAVSDSIDVRVVSSQYSEGDLQKIVDAVAAEATNAVPDASFGVGMSIDRSRSMNDEIISVDLEAASVPMSERTDVVARLGDAARLAGGHPELLMVDFGEAITPDLAVAD